MDWRNLNYLQLGNPRQQAAYKALQQTQVMTRLQAYDPVLVGTIPIAIDIMNSDLDIICHATDLDAFLQHTREQFQQVEEYTAQHHHHGQEHYALVNFRAYDFEFELYAQDKPVIEQNAYRHMMIEYRLLQLGGDKARKAVIALKKQGLKTEPAFVQVFNIQAIDPYDALLELLNYDDKQLRKLMTS